MSGVVLFKRDAGPTCSAPDMERALAHRLLDTVRAGLANCSDAEIARALWITGDTKPNAKHLGGWAALQEKRLAAMT